MSRADGSSNETVIFSLSDGLRFTQSWISESNLFSSGCGSLIRILFSSFPLWPVRQGGNLMALSV
jgi:hypothetical protein